MELASAAVELNTDELLRVGFGLELKDKEQLLAARFPESPDDQAALSILQEPHKTPTAEDAEDAEDGDDGDDGGDDGDDTAVEPVDKLGVEVLDTEPEPRQSSPEMERKYKHERIKREKDAATQQQADREEAARQAEKIAAEAKKLDREAEQELLDLKWEAFAGDTSGSIRNRRWQQFRKQNPRCIRKKTQK
jgi:hypothetical protein